MDERRALIAAIVANPEEDTPRLVLADWLDEHGDKHDRARAEFIRLQCRLARLPEGDPERPALQKREKQLAARHWLDWLGPLKGFLWHDVQPDFTRGLLFWWYTTPGRFVKKDHQEAVGAGFPTVGVNSLHLWEPTKRPQLVADSPALAWVPKLTWTDARAEDPVFEALAASPHLGRLSTLVIEKPWCTDRGLTALAKSKGLPNLRTFGLQNGLWRGRYSTKGVLRVLNSPNLPHLDALDLSKTQPIDVKWRAFFHDPGLSRLKWLWLGFQSAMHELARCPHLTALEVLDVSDTTITDADVSVLVANPALRNLRTVSLFDMNASELPLSRVAEERLRERFGDGLSLEYSILVRRG
jgi:uncharacterized protein (TIGR02996 family)